MFNQVFDEPGFSRSSWTGDKEVVPRLKSREGILLVDTECVGHSDSVIRRVWFICVLVTYKAESIFLETQHDSVYVALYDFRTMFSQLLYFLLEIERHRGVVVDVVSRWSTNIDTQMIREWIKGADGLVDVVYPVITTPVDDFRGEIIAE